MSGEELRATLEDWLATRHAASRWTGPPEWTAVDGYAAAVEEIRSILDSTPAETWPRPADFEQMSPEEFDAYVVRTGFDKRLRAALAAPSTPEPSGLREAALDPEVAALDVERLADILDGFDPTGRLNHAVLARLAESR